MPNYVETAMDQEIQNFLVKFRSMASAGYKAHLNITSENREVIVSFNVNLGPMSPSPLHNSFSSYRHRPPRYHRRQAKQKK